ncbi:MAG: DUF2512 family protein [Bacillota bacterium]|nr:DUF2512 family protein [Bacillota bacterium]
MVGLILKIILCPLVVILSDYLLAGIYYPTVYEAIAVGFVIAIIGHLMELVILKRGTVWISAAADLVAAFVVIYLSQYFITRAVITVGGAIIAAIIVAIVEYVDHVFLVKSDRTRKTE